VRGHVRRWKERVNVLTRMRVLRILLRWEMHGGIIQGQIQGRARGELRERRERRRGRRGRRDRRVGASTLIVGRRVVVDRMGMGDG
jgi:hypothetical protein